MKVIIVALDEWEQKSLEHVYCELFVHVWLP